MNLVQVQEKIKDLPLSAVKAYANGSNPEVPPYVALGELKRRETMEKDAAMHMQAQKGAQPTVKDQIEQEVGLMALQRQQQAQGQQQQAQQMQQQPQPIPGGIPQPSAPAQPEQAMAMGGVAGLPVDDGMFEYGSGGIIAFSGKEGSVVPGLDDPEFIARTKQAIAEPDQEKEIEQYRKRQAAFGLDTPAGQEQEKRLQGIQALYEQSIADRPNERLLQVLSGIGRGSLGGAAPAYLNALQAERAADAANLQKQHEALSAIEKERRGESSAGMGKVGEEVSKMRSTGAETAGRMAGSQMQAATTLEAERMRNAAQEKIHAMDRDTQLKIAALDRQLRASLHGTPSATLESQMIDEYVKTGLSRTEAYERIKQLSSGYKGEMTYDQATDNAQKFLESTQGMSYIQERRADAKKNGQPVPSTIEIRDELIRNEMSKSGRPAAPGASSNKKVLDFSKI
jgi:hypothetical protein